MSRHSQAVTSAIWEKLQRLPAGKQAAVLNFVESLGSARSQRGKEPAVYDYTATVVKRKRLKKLSLAKIAAIVRQVRHGHDSARGL
ncbi:MAG: hypothetical protein KGO52_03265 [Nitrospirota bacterium]|nr:hypothetical protein [Nitrospirota bacterium]MDE3224145.1 hypothetical protein [Nitrospirota bacterium]MDE3241724.1 hypothetical protein [Nitrospirota bacterium]